MERINEAINQKMEEYIQSDKMKEFISQKAEDSINSIIEDMFRWSGPIKKELEKQINDALVFNKDLGLTGLNKFVTEEMQRKIKLKVRKDTAELVDKSLNDMLDNQPKIVKAYDFLEKVKRFFEKENKYSCSCEPWDKDYWNKYGTIIIEEPDETICDWLDIYIDMEPEKSSYDSKFNLTVYKSGRTTYKIRNKDLSTKDLIMGYQFDLEDYFYSLFLNDSTIDYDSLMKEYKSGEYAY